MRQGPAIQTHLSQFLQPILHSRCQHLQHLQSGWSGEWKRVPPAPPRQPHHRRHPDVRPEGSRSGGAAGHCWCTGTPALPGRPPPAPCLAPRGQASRGPALGPEVVGRSCIDRPTSTGGQTPPAVLDRPQSKHHCGKGEDRTREEEAGVLGTSFRLCLCPL